MSIVFDSSYISGGDVRIEKDPDMTKLAQEARRLSMGQQNSQAADGDGSSSRQAGAGGVGRRRTSNSPAAAASSVRNGSSNGSSGPREAIQ